MEGTGIGHPGRSRNHLPSLTCIMLSSLQLYLSREERKSKKKKKLFKLYSREASKKSNNLPVIFIAGTSTVIL